jgi:hypothetical protein
LVIWIDENLDRQMIDLAAHLLGVEAQDHDDALNAALLERADDALDKCLAVDGQQRFGAAHAARFTGGKNDSDDHDRNSML